MGEWGGVGGEDSLPFDEDHESRVGDDGGSLAEVAEGHEVLKELLAGELSAALLQRPA